MNEYISVSTFKKCLLALDLTKPIYGHSIWLSIEEIKNNFLKKKCFPPVNIIDCSRLSTPQEEFDQLYIPFDSPMRSKKYAMYINEQCLLRTHPTPGLIKFLTSLQNIQGVNDYLIFLPAICFPRSKIDKSKSQIVHKIDIWRIKQGYPQLTQQDLYELVNTTLSNNSWIVQTTPTIHPYTINGISGEISLPNSHCMKFFEGGEICQKIFKLAKLDYKKYSGVGIGLALERYVMATKNIFDARIFQSSDPEIKSQMFHLNEYIPQTISATYEERKLDVNLPLHIELIDICDFLREYLGEESNLIEHIKVIKEGEKKINCKTKHVTLLIKFSSLNKKISISEVSQVLYKIKEGITENFGFA